MSCPQLVPFAMFVTVQAGAPVVGSQVIAARWHTVGGVAGVQVPPAEQTQAPPWHTWSWPQLVPSGRLLTLQVAAPVVGSQVIAAVWHTVGGVDGVQEAPDAHVQAPSWQTSPVPQVVPFGRFVTVQDGAPVASQVTAAVWHDVGGGVGAQVAPAVQVHTPVLQAR